MGPDNGAIAVVNIPVDPAERFGLRPDGIKHALPKAGPLPPVDPMFKGVWYGVANFAVLWVPHTK